MGRPKKALKVKEPIRLRERKLANGNLGLYLDIYVKGTRKYESLGCISSQRRPHWTSR